MSRGFKQKRDSKRGSSQHINHLSREWICCRCGTKSRKQPKPMVLLCEECVAGRDIVVGETD